MLDAPDRRSDAAFMAPFCQETVTFTFAGPDPVRRVQ
jgi:hypothetical protein